MRDTSQIFEKVFPLFKEHEKSAFLLFSRYWDCEDKDNDQMICFNECP